MAGINAESGPIGFSSILPVFIRSLVHFMTISRSSGRANGRRAGRSRYQ